MPVDKVARVAAQGQKVRRIELLGFVNVYWHHMVNLKRFAATTCLAHWLTLQMLPPHAGPLPRARCAE